VVPLQVGRWACDQEAMRLTLASESPTQFIHLYVAYSFIKKLHVKTQATESYQIV